MSMVNVLNTMRSKIRKFRISMSKINPFNWKAKTRKTLFVIAIAIAALLVYRFYLYPNSDAVLKAIGLRPDAFISPEVYGGIIQSAVTALAIYGTYKVYEKQKRDTLSQKVYDKKFETYLQLWEKMQDINGHVLDFIINSYDLSSLSNELAEFCKLLTSKSLVISKQLKQLLTLWAFSTGQLTTSMALISDIEQRYRFFDQADRQREEFQDLAFETMKKELGFEKLEKEINLSVDYNVPENFPEQLKYILIYGSSKRDDTRDFLRDEISMLLKLYKDKGEKIPLNEFLKKLTKQADDHLTESNDQEKVIK